MASSELEIYNMAFAECGSHGLIQAIDEDSAEAELLTLFYDSARDQVLASAMWPETRAVSRLALASEVGDDPWISSYPLPGYQYAYSAPPDMLRPRYAADFSPFELMTTAANAKLIISDREDLVFYYSRQQPNVSTWGPSLTMAIIYALAAHVCVPLTGKQSRGATLAQQANGLILEARTQAANDAGTQQYDAPAEWHAARGYTGFSILPRYVYPNGGLVSVKGTVA